MIFSLVSTLNFRWDINKLCNLRNIDHFWREAWKVNRLLSYWKIYQPVIFVIYILEFANAVINLATSIHVFIGKVGQKSITKILTNIIYLVMISLRSRAFYTSLTNCRWTVALWLKGPESSVYMIHGIITGSMSAKFSRVNYNFQGCQTIF